jgi:hypothetical protein
VTGVRLRSVVVGGGAAPWEALGFAVVDGLVPFVNGAVECDGDEAGGVLALRLFGLDETLDVDGVTVLSGPPPAASVTHPNGCTELDHVVIMTPSMERTSAAVERQLGLPLRRVREAGSVRQGFHRFPDRGCIVEVVETDRAERASLWGFVVIADDLDAFCAAAGDDLVGAPRPAVQPERRIATVRSAAGLPCAVAVMSR